LARFSVKQAGRFLPYLAAGGGAGYYLGNKIKDNY